MDAPTDGLAVKYLCKVFSEKSHAEAFVSGNVIIRTLESFQNTLDPGRRDRHEGLCGIFQPERSTLVINGRSLDPADLAGPILVSRHMHAHLYVLCMYAGVIEKNATLSQEQFESRLRLNPASQCFGKWVVFLSKPQEFIGRLTVAAEQAGVRLKSRGLVQYYDPQKADGVFRDDLVPFMKDSRFSKQNEYRCVFEAQSSLGPSVALTTQDMCDIAHCLSCTEFNSSLRCPPR